MPDGTLGYLKIGGSFCIYFPFMGFLVYNFLSSRKSVRTKILEVQHVCWMNV